MSPHIISQSIEHPERRPVSTVRSRPVSLQLAEGRGRLFDLTGPDPPRGKLTRTETSDPAGGAHSTCAIYPHPSPAKIIFACRTGRSDQQDDGHTHPDGRHPPKRYSLAANNNNSNNKRLLKSLTDIESRRKEVTQEAETLSSLVMTLSSPKHSAAQGMQLTRDAHHAATQQAQNKRIEKSH